MEFRIALENIINMKHKDGYALVTEKDIVGTVKREGLDIVIYIYEDEENEP